MTSAFFSISVNFTFQGNDVILYTQTKFHTFICLKSICLWNLCWLWMWNTVCSTATVRRVFDDGRSALASKQSENESFQFNSVRSTKYIWIYFHFLLLLLLLSNQQKLDLNMHCSLNRYVDQQIGCASSVVDAPFLFKRKIRSMFAKSVKHHQIHIERL